MALSNRNRKTDYANLIANSCFHKRNGNFNDNCFPNDKLNYLRKENKNRTLQISNVADKAICKMAQQRTYLVPDEATLWYKTQFADSIKCINSQSDALSDYMRQVFPERLEASKFKRISPEFLKILQRHTDRVRQSVEEEIRNKLKRDNWNYSSKTECSLKKKKRTNCQAVNTNNSCDTKSKTKVCFELNIEKMEGAKQCKTPKKKNCFSKSAFKSPDRACQRVVIKLSSTTPFSIAPLQKSRQCCGANPDQKSNENALNLSSSRTVKFSNLESNMNEKISLRHGQQRLASGYDRLSPTGTQSVLSNESPPRVVQQVSRVKKKQTKREFRCQQRKRCSQRSLTPYSSCSDLKPATPISEIWRNCNYNAERSPNSSNSNMHFESTVNSNANLSQTRLVGGCDEPNSSLISFAGHRSILSSHELSNSQVNIKTKQRQVYNNKKKVKDSNKKRFDIKKILRKVSPNRKKREGYANGLPAERSVRKRESESSKGKKFSDTNHETDVSDGKKSSESSLASLQSKRFSINKSSNRILSQNKEISLHSTNAQEFISGKFIPADYFLKYKNRASYDSLSFDKQTNKILGQKPPNQKLSAPRDVVQNLNQTDVTRNYRQYHKQNTRISPQSPTQRQKCENHHFTNNNSLEESRIHYNWKNEKQNGPKEMSVMKSLPNSGNRIVEKIKAQGGRKVYAAMNDNRKSTAYKNQTSDAHKIQHKKTNPLLKNTSTSGIESNAAFTSEIFMEKKHPVKATRYKSGQSSETSTDGSRNSKPIHYNAVYKATTLKDRPSYGKIISDNVRNEIGSSTDVEQTVKVTRYLSNYSNSSTPSSDSETDDPGNHKLRACNREVELNKTPVMSQTTKVQDAVASDTNNTLSSPSATDLEQTAKKLREKNKFIQYEKNVIRYDHGKQPTRNFHNAEHKKSLAGGSESDNVRYSYKKKNSQFKRNRELQPIFKEKFSNTIENISKPKKTRPKTIKYPTSLDIPSKSKKHRFDKSKINNGYTITKRNTRALSPISKRTSKSYPKQLLRHFRKSSHTSLLSSTSPSSPARNTNIRLNSGEAKKTRDTHPASSNNWKLHKSISKYLKERFSEKPTSSQNKAFNYSKAVAKKNFILPDNTPGLHNLHVNPSAFHREINKELKQNIHSNRRQMVILDLFDDRPKNRRMYKLKAIQKTMDSSRIERSKSQRNNDSKHEPSSDEELLEVLDLSEETEESASSDDIREASYIKKTIDCNSFMRLNSESNNNSSHTNKKDQNPKMIFDLFGENSQNNDLHKFAFEKTIDRNRYIEAEYLKSQPKQQLSIQKTLRMPAKTKYPGVSTAFRPEYVLGQTRKTAGLTKKSQNKRYREK